MLGAAALLGVLTLLGRTTPWILLVLVFAYGLGAAVNLPAWQAIMPDLVPSREMPSAVTLSSITINLSRAIGPVLVTIEYRVDPGKADEFAQAMQELGRVRRRDGAAFWGLYRDLSDPRRHVETFIVESWAEHVRQHGRATVEDRRVQERILAFHSGDGPPAVSHCIAEPRAA
jgi:quinol monooxygenase YgiN